MVLTFFSILLLGMYAALIVYYRTSWQQLPESGPGNASGLMSQVSVAIIIPARNEAGNIDNLVRSLLAQTYPAHLLEIRIVDDFSTDDTALLVNRYAKSYSHIRLVTFSVPAGNQAYKKRAIEAGIRASTAPLIVCTDADCVFHPQWIETLVTWQQQTNARFIAAPVDFITEKTILSVFQSLDFMTMQGITGASVHRQFHTMCNGANLLYTRQAFTEVNGFNGIDHIPTGDDMLLMYKIYRQHPQQVYYLKEKKAVVRTPATATWKAFFHQRIRWASKAVHYDDQRIFWTLVLVYLFNAWFLVLAVAAWWHAGYGLLLLLTLVIKTSVECWFLWPVARFFEKQTWLKWFPWLQPLHILYIVIAGWLGRFGSYQWKGRTVHKTPVTSEPGRSGRLP